MKRFVSVFAVILVLTACVSVPSSAGFAAGVSPNGHTIVEALVNDSIYDNTPSSGQYVITDGLGAFYDTQPIYLYRDGDRPRYGVSIYSFSDNNHAFYGGFISGDALNDLYGNTAHLSGYYYPIAFSRTRGSIGWTRFIDNGSNLYVYNPHVHNVDAGDVSLPLPYPLTGDPSLYYKVLGSQKYSYEFLTTENENLDVYTSLFDSWDKLMSALDRAEQDPSPSPVSGSVSITIPAGHVAVIKSSNFDIVGRTTQVIAGNASEGMPYTNQLYGYFTSLPSQFNQNSFSYGMMWTPVSPFDSSGWTKSARWEESKGSIGVDSEPYIAICNPMYCFSRGREDPYFMTLNNPVYLTVTGVIEQIWDVPLRTYITQAAGSAAQAAGSSDPGVIYEGVWDSSTPGSPVTYQTSDGEVFTPQSGGLTVTDPETDFFGSISSAFESFTSIFTWGHNAVRSIIDGSRDFFVAFTSIFSWMPSEVLSVLSACLILILVIGVVKVLL